MDSNNRAAKIAGILFLIQLIKYRFPIRKSRFRQRINEHTKPQITPYKKVLKALFVQTVERTLAVRKLMVVKKILRLIELCSTV